MTSTAPAKEYLKKRLMSKSEIEFFHKLLTGLKGLHVFPQVSMNAVLDIKFQKSEKDRYHYWAKYIDFVVCAPDTFDIIAVIEYDEPYHDKPEQKLKDAQRDDMLKDAGYIVLRYKQAEKIDPKKLHKDFKQIYVRYELLRGIDLNEVAKKFRAMPD